MFHSQTAVYILSAVFATLLQGADPVAYVSTSAQSALVTIDTASGQMTNRFVAGVDGQDFVLSPDGSTAYVASSLSDNIQIINLSTGERIGTLPANRGPVTLAISSDGSRLYVANDDSHSLTIVDVPNARKIADFPIGGSRYVSAATTPDGSKVYVSGSTGVIAIDTSTNSVVGTIEWNEAQRLAISPPATAFTPPVPIPSGSSMSSIPLLIRSFPACPLLIGYEPTMSQ